MTDEQRFWFSFIEEAYRVGYEAYARVARENLPSRLQEQALVDYFKSREEEVCRRIGKKIDLVRQKPYTGTHNSGYTECQEFYGAITLNSDGTLGDRIVTMLDVAVRGVGNMWNDAVIPGLDYILVEKTLGKYGKRVEDQETFVVESVPHLEDFEMDLARIRWQTLIRGTGKEGCGTSGAA